MTSLKIAFIGLGEHAGRAHIKHLLAMNAQEAYKGQIELIGAFDPSAIAFNDIERENGIRLHRFATLRDLFAAQPDAAFICSPDEYHTAQLRMCVEQGVHVFCEKPMAVSEDDAKSLREYLAGAEARGVLVSSCHPRRFDPPFMFLKEALPKFIEGQGPLRHIDYSFWYHEVTDEWKKNRSLLSDHLGHELDLVRMLTGGSSFKAMKLADSYDHYEVTGSIAGGPSFRFLGNRALAEREYIEAVRLDFAKTSLFFNTTTGEGLNLRTGETFSIPATDYDQRFLTVNVDFIEAVLGRRTPYLSMQDMLANNISSVELDHGHTTVFEGGA